jgi:hypothetical protein
MPRGYSVFPLHSVRNGRCTCGKAECADPGKHPRWRKGDLEHGLKDATTDQALITSWWRAFPRSNIGLATGASNLVVIDVDVKDGKLGEESLHDLMVQHGRSAFDTVTQRTGSGGEHYIFRRPENVSIGNFTDWRAGIDIRAEGGYIVVPPSVHISGKPYVWQIDDTREGDDGLLSVTPAELPGSLAKALGARRTFTSMPGGKRREQQRPPRRYPCLDPMLLEGHRPGSRNRFAFLLALRLRAAGTGDASALEQLAAWNALNQGPEPLTAGELQKTWESAANYPDGMNCDDPLIKAHCVTSCPIHRAHPNQVYAALKQIKTDPPSYRLLVQLKPEDDLVELEFASRDDLLNHRKVRNLCWEQTTHFPPALKGPDWEARLEDLLINAEVLDVPAEATTAGIVWDVVQSFLATRADDEDGLRPERIAVEQGDRVYFRGRDLREHLRAEAAPDIKPGSLWSILRDHGGESGTQRFGEDVLWVWSLPLSACRGENEAP